MTTPTGLKRWKLGLLAGTFAFGPLLPGFADESPPPSPVARQERDLVVAVHKSRDDYQRSLEILHGYYIRNKNEEGRYWVEREMTQVHMMVKDPYLLDLDLPSASLRPTQNIPEATKIFRAAYDFLNKASFTETEKNYHRAELLLRRLLNDYRTSDKIDEACYYLGEIYSSKYYEQYRRAVAFYERVFLYEPNTNLNARLKAGIVYEKHLGDREKAKQLYQEVLARQSDSSQTKEARRRLDRLLGSRSPAR